MATRAFLLCGDEKAVHAISQILDELEVSFEHSSEPPFALKRLPAQRFDLLIVDCDNAQNATQVFNIARASSLNKNSIAIAIVEGKAGVPNAFRLGASLVLTKPVSLEQARNTLRTGVGMTKKDGPETKATASAPAIPHATTPVTAAPPAPAHVNPPAPHVPASATVTPVTPHVVTAPPVAPPQVIPPPAAKTPAVPLVPVAPTAATSTPAASSISPATAPADTKPAPAAFVEKPAVAPKAATVAPPPPEAKPVANSTTETKVPSVAAATPVAKAAAAATGTAPTTSTSTGTSPSVVKAETASSTLSARGDKKSLDAEKKSSELSEATTILKIEDPLADELDALDPLKDHGVPSFGALSREPFAGIETDKPRRSKLPLVAALVLVLLGGGAYAAWLTQPNFRALMISEFGNAKTKVDAMRGKEPITAAAKPQPAPIAPVPVQPAAAAATQNSENIDVSMTPNGTASDSTADPNANNAPATTPSDTTTNSTGTPTSGNASTTKATEPAAPTPATATKTDTTKQPKLQSAKQDATPGKSAALVPASLPPTTTAKAPSSDLLEVPEDFADDQVIHRVHPTYPKQALTKKLHGSVTLQVIVNKQGKVDSLALVSGDPVLGQAAQSAVKQWRYKPYWHNGEPTDFQTHVTVDFKLP
jgi:TonB family protein